MAIRAGRRASEGVAQGDGPGVVVAGTLQLPVRVDEPRSPYVHLQDGRFGKPSNAPTRGALGVPAPRPEGADLDPGEP
ncbi:hypothetical protein ACWD0G_00065 [Streptomyces goshikiensis]